MHKLTIHHQHSTKMQSNQIPEMHNPPPPPPLTMEGIRMLKYYEIEQVKTKYEHDKEKARSSANAFVSGFILGIGFIMLILAIMAHN